MIFIKFNYIVIIFALSVECRHFQEPNTHSIHQPQQKWQQQHQQNRVFVITLTTEGDGRQNPRSQYKKHAQMNCI